VLWRFHLRRSMPKWIVAAQSSHLDRNDRGIAVGGGNFRVVGGAIGANVTAMNCVGDNGFPWRGGTRGNKTKR
jgi:hypothetical protein